MRRSSRHAQRKQQAGFTLVELILGIIVLAISLVFLATAIFPESGRSVSNLHRVRAAELAHSILNEAWNSRYDENSGPSGGLPACNGNDPLSKTCTPSSLFGPCVANDCGQVKPRDFYSDVDDYHGLNQNTLMVSSSRTYSDDYPGYQVEVTVYYPSSSGAEDQSQKIIEVAVTTPGNEVIPFHAIRSNY
ncbi:type II secretion system protein [Alginatibacterium sediminis]|uniref:Type II secretion system protein n=1 Tax=Alginatibacterium sediminis TaxID=2164068 RepID=A0A420EL11_9ALTE|nr:type II secretion system protein [Alginatibacterium sediminis]RKF21369.1 type II secretion system protein [Alginatibacterium sediminis]